nr:TRAP transporter large permease subunit [uncultured Desulfobacter sp.]
MTVTFIGIILAASTKIIGASVVLLGLLSMPVMLNQGYSKSLACGTICGAGTIGILIPPSIMLVMMADRLGLPMGDLFMGALFPSPLLATLYMVYILSLAWLSPPKASLVPDQPDLTWQLLGSALKTCIPPVIVLFAVLGTISFGMATPTEASRIVAFILGDTYLKNHLIPALHMTEPLIPVT